MGNSCSCLNLRREGYRVKDPHRLESNWFPVPPESEQEHLRDELTEIVKLDNGELVKKRNVLPHGAAANLASLICQAFDLSQISIHSKECAFFLVKKLISIQEAILDDRLLLADGVLMLKAQELALEVGQMIKQFSRRGWLVRLNKADVDDELEFSRLCHRLNVLREQCGLGTLSDPTEAEDFYPVSGTLMKFIKSMGSLQSQMSKNEDELKVFINKLLPLLSTEDEAAAISIDEEIRIAAAAEMPGAHSVIRHSDMSYIWWTYLQAEEIRWEDFWRIFLESIDDFEGSLGDIGDIDNIKTMLQSPASRRLFRNVVSSSRNSEYVLSIEIDHAFPPNRTIEESVGIILSPVEDDPASTRYRERLLHQNPMTGYSRVIRDQAGTPAEGTEIVGRQEEIGRLCGAIETGKYVVMVTGPPGVGKTAVAATVADELLKSRVLNRVYYINLTGVSELTDAVYRIGAALKHPIYQSSLGSEDRLKNWLKRHGNLLSPTGWVLDGLDNLFMDSDAKLGLLELLQEILKFSPRLYLIMTCSTTPDPSEMLIVDEVMELHPLPDEDANQLAESLLGRALSKGEAQQLVAATDGYPLGIKIGGSAILTGGCSAIHLEQRLKLVRHTEQGAMRAPWNRAHDMIREGINLLPQEDKHKLILLCQCPTDFTIEHAAAVLEQIQRPTETWSLLWRLMMRGFIRRIPPEGSYRVEEAVMDVVKHCTRIVLVREDDVMESPSTALEIDEGRRDASRSGLVIYYLRLLDKALSVYRGGCRLSTYRMLEQERDGLERFVGYLSEPSVRKKLMAAGSKGKLLKLLKILNDFVVDVGKNYFNWAQVSSLCASVGWLWEEDQSPIYDEVSYKLRLSLANALACIGERRDAEAILNQLEAHIDHLGSCADRDLKAKADVIVLRAKIHHLVQRYPEAERYFLQGLGVQQTAYGPEHFTISRTFSLLATVQQTLGKFGEAEQSYKNSLKIRMKHSHKNVVEVPMVMHNWASLNHRLGRYTDAETLYNKSLILRQKYFGHRNIEVASSLTSLAAVKVSLEKRCEARDLYDSALAILKDIIGEEHQAVAYTSTRLGVLLEMEKCYDEAILNFADALMIDEKVYGQKHEQVRKSIERIMRAAQKHAQTLRTAKQMSRWKEYIEELLSKFQVKWPVQRTGAMETSADLMASTFSISQVIAPEAHVPEDAHLRSTDNSFQGFATRGKEESVSGSEFGTTNSSDQNRSVAEGSRGSGLQKSSFAVDPPIQDPGKLPASMMSTTGASDINFTQQDMTRTVSHDYPSVHDNSQFRKQGPSGLDTRSLQQTQDLSFNFSPNILTTFTLEDDLLETTSLVPEQYDAVQSMIRNPLYRSEERPSAISSIETPEPLINTHASFEL